jgi:hypothetical protein
MSSKSSSKPLKGKEFPPKTEPRAAVRVAKIANPLRTTKPRRVRRLPHALAIDEHAPTKC